MKMASSVASGRIFHGELEGLLAKMMPPGVSRAEIAELTRKCQSNIDDGVDEVSLEEIAASLVAAGADGSDDAKRILSTRDLIFRAWHGGKSRQAVLLSSLKCAHLLFLCLCLIVLQIVLVAIGTIHVVQEPSGAAIAACSSSFAMLIATAIGMVGLWRLLADLKADADGRGSVAQRFLEVFFWFVSVLAVAAVVTEAIGIEMWLSGRADAALKDEASKFPASFALKAKTLAIEAIPNTGSVSAMQGAMAILRMTGASVGGVHLLLTLPALWCVANIVTFAELYRDIVRILSTLVAIASCAIIVFSGQGFALVTVLFTLDGTPFSAMSVPLVLTSACCFVCVCMVIPLAIFGHLAAHHENLRKLQLFSKFAIGVAVLSCASGVALLTSMPPFVEQQLEPSKCRVILQSLPEAWLASLPLHAGCSKYYGRAVRLDDSSEMFVDPRSASVGLITNCLDPRDRTFAWEYAQQVVGANASSCTGAALYACVNADHSGCCSSLNTSISFYFVALWNLLLCHQCFSVARCIGCTFGDHSLSQKSCSEASCARAHAQNQAHESRAFVVHLHVYIHARRTLGTG